MFVAHGPSFKESTQVRPFHNIDLYNLMCVMIDIVPVPNNGTWVSLIGMLPDVSFVNKNRLLIA